MIQALTLERVSHHETRIVPNEIEIRDSLTRISQQRIKSSRYAEVRCIQCEVHEGILVLSGRVSSYYMKQLAQEAVRSVEGIGGVTNYVEVVDPVSLLEANSDQSPKE